jgi:beta-glucanase (GH16 family)
VVFEDHFHEEKLAEHWNTKPFWSTCQLSENYVQNIEAHGLDAQNVYVQGGVLTIVTKKAVNAGLAWDEKYGFLPSRFNYASGIINTAGHFQTKPTQGKIEIKLRVPSVANTYHACWLNCGKKTPAISVFNFCNNKYETGIYQDEYDDKIRRHIKLIHAHFYIVQLEWDENYITWRINGKKIAQKPNTIDLPLHLNITSGVIGKVRDAKLPAHFELDWVKVFETA